MEIFTRQKLKSFDMKAVGLDGEKYSICQNKDYWISQNGVKNYPEEFDYDHLVNTVLKIERKCYKEYVSPKIFKIYRLLKEELEYRISNDTKLF